MISFIALSAYLLPIVGEISFGQQAFFAISAYTSGIATAMWGWGFWRGLPWGAAMATAAAILVGISTFRMRGLYFSIATLAFAEMRRLVSWTTGTVIVPILRYRGVAASSFPPSGARCVERHCIQVRGKSGSNSRCASASLRRARPSLSPLGATHWSLRSMARAVGYAPSTIHRIWRAFGLQPHRAETFKLSTDPLFVEKVRDIVGLYLDPPERALVLCVDEKGQIQALDRSRPMLPMRPGQVERRTHDYMRHGTTTPFAALDIATGKVIGQCFARRRGLEFREFLRTLEVRVPADFDIHLAMDNFATHKTPAVRRWLAGHPRWRVHFTPTGASWLNQVERFFALLTEKQLRRGAHRSTQELEKAVRRYIDSVNANPRPFRWTMSADDILATIKRFCLRTLDAAQRHGEIIKTSESGQ